MQIRPKIIKPIELLTIMANNSFSISIADHFEPQDGSLSFNISSSHPEWLKIDQDAGVLFGNAPRTKHEKVFSIYITARNQSGLVTENFTLKLLCADVIEEGQTTLINILSKRKETYISPLYTFIPDLLQYVLAYFQVPALIDELYLSLEPFANELNLPLDKDVPYKQFKDIITKLNPNIEASLQEIADERLMKQAINNHQLQNLYRQGSQQTGVITIPVWNHLGGVDQCNWSSIKTVLDSAALEVAKLHDVKHIERAARINPQLRPKGHPNG